MILQVGDRERRAKLDGLHRHQPGIGVHVILVRAHAQAAHDRMRFAFRTRPKIETERRKRHVQRANPAPASHVEDLPFVETAVGLDFN